VPLAERHCYTVRLAHRIYNQPASARRAYSSRGLTADSRVLRARFPHTY